MVFSSRSLGLGAVCAAWFAAASPALTSDLGYAPPAPSGWEFNFTPYAWMINVNGNVTARGHSAGINENFFQIVDKSDSLLAWMSYFEVRKGRLSFFTDFVWMDLGFPGRFQASRSRSGRFSSQTLNVSGKGQLDYEQIIIQSGLAYEIARWEAGPQRYTALDLIGSARYWNAETDLSLRLRGTLEVELERRGLNFKRSRQVAVARSGELEWVDPVVGARIRHQMAQGKELRLEGDVGGFGVGSDFSWQAVATYGFDINCLGRPLHTVVGYRALAVDYSENGRFGKNELDVVQHGPVMGVSFRW
jgi:hypothetical protein